MKVVYIAGPYQHPYPPYNVRTAVEWADQVWALGAAPVVPHLTMLYDIISPHPYEDWLALDLEIMRRSDVVLRIPGDSRGADAEVTEAEKIGIPVFFSVESLKGWLDV